MVANRALNGSLLALAVVGVLALLLTWLPLAKAEDAKELALAVDEDVLTNPLLDLAKAGANRLTDMTMMTPAHRRLGRGRTGTRSA